MNGIFPIAASLSNVGRISAADRTSTTSPGRNGRLSADVMAQQPDDEMDIKLAIIILFNRQQE
jgi:hypothetical protein